MIETETAERIAAKQLGGTWEARRFGSGRFSETFLLSAGEDDYILRIAPPDDLRQLFYEYRMMRQEPELHAVIRSRTSLPVPEIRAYDFSRTMIDRDYLIMPRVPGTPLSDTSLSQRAHERALRSWGEYIRILHGIQAEDGLFGYRGAHRPMEPRSSWREAFREMYRLELEDILQCGVYGKEERDYALRLLDEHLDVFSGIQAPVLCHGDIWVTNLMVAGDGTVTALIDFDRACWGDPEWDLAIADYCGVTEEPFVKGYGGDPREGSEGAAVRRLFYILYEHQKYIVIAVSSRRNDPRGAKRYAEQSLEIMRRFRSTGRPVV
jgi:aminoglycoside phosphotransferase (APT) family kinase protein